MGRGTSQDANSNRPRTRDGASQRGASRPGPQGVAGLWHAGVCKCEPEPAPTGIGVTLSCARASRHFAPRNEPVEALAAVGTAVVAPRRLRLALAALAIMPPHRLLPVIAHLVRLVPALSPSAIRDVGVRGGCGSVPFGRRSVRFGRDATAAGEHSDEERANPAIPVHRDACPQSTCQLRGGKCSKQSASACRAVLTR